MAQNVTQNIPAPNDPDLDLIDVYEHILER